MGVTIVVGLMLPQAFVDPVAGMRHPVPGEKGSGDYDLASFWYDPWGRSGTHKGVDIFAKEGTAVRSATAGVVTSVGTNERGGNHVIVLGPKWRFHYYAHLESIDAELFSIVSPGTRIGSVGDTGNAAGKPHHLHYVVFTAVPYPWRWDGSRQGWRKMFYLDPTSYLQRTTRG